MLHPFPNICYSPPHTLPSLSFHAAQSQALAPFFLGKRNLIAWNTPSLSLLHPGDLPGPSCLWSMFTVSMNSQAVLVAHPGSHKLCSSWIYFSVFYLLCITNSLQVRMGLLTSDATASSMAPHTKQLLNTTCMGGGMSPNVLLQILFDFWSPMPLPWDPADFSALICSKWSPFFLPVNHKFPGFLFYVIPVLDPTFCARTKGYQDKQDSAMPSRRA